MSRHKHDGRPRTQGRTNGNPQKTITHMHDGTVSNHTLKVCLCYGYESHKQYITQGQPE